MWCFAGATLLWDSDPDAEEEETRLKASAFLDAITNATSGNTDSVEPPADGGDGSSVSVVLIDHQVLCKRWCPVTPAFK